MRSLTSTLAIALSSLFLLTNATIIQLARRDVMDFTGPRGINDSDVIVGTLSSLSSALQLPAKWDSTGALTVLTVPSAPLAYSAAAAVNASGVIAGTGATGAISLLAFRYDSSGATVLSSPSGSAVAFGINDDGYICGSRQTAAPAAKATVWQPWGGIWDLGTLGGSSATAYGISKSLLSVGESMTSTGDFHAFLFWGAMRDLGTLGGRSSRARAIIEDRKPMTDADIWVVGDSTDASGADHGFAWNGDVMTELAAGYPASDAYAINAAHSIAGSVTYAPFKTRAVVFDPSGSFVDLNSLLPPDSGWVLVQATGINNLGHVVGNGLKDGVPRGFLLIP